MLRSIVMVVLLLQIKRVLMLLQLSQTVSGVLIKMTYSEAKAYVDEHNLVYEEPKYVE